MRWTSSTPQCEIHVDVTARAAGRRGPYVGHDGMRRYFADVEAVWQKLEIHAEDYRVIPGSVVVMGHVEGRGDDGPFRRARACGRGSSPAAAPRE